MKSKAPLSLIEQLCMLLVFALSAGLCLQIYVLSGQISRRCETRSEAVTAVQNIAETLKHSRGDDICLHTGFDENWEAVPVEDASYYISIIPEDTGLPTLGRATVTASDESGAEIFSVTVSWQEEVAHE